MGSIYEPLSQVFISFLANFLIPIWGTMVQPTKPPAPGQSYNILFILSSFSALRILIIILLETPYVYSINGISLVLLIIALVEFSHGASFL